MGCAMVDLRSSPYFVSVPTTVQELSRWQRNRMKRLFGPLGSFRYSMRYSQRLHYLRRSSCAFQCQFRDVTGRRLTLPAGKSPCCKQDLSLPMNKCTVLLLIVERYVSL